MTKVHTISMTYKPKIEPVFSRECHRTLRFTRKIKEGDKLLIHDWVGVPYRSKWGRRLYVEVMCVRSVIVDMKCIKTLDRTGENWFSTPWEDDIAAYMAKEDGIVKPEWDKRPLGLVWRDILIGLNKHARKPVDLEAGAEGSIIIWDDGRILMKRNGADLEGGRQ
jgi:hypothetical protein